MPMMKQENGAIDQEDYFLTGSFTDFLGGGVCSRRDGVFEVQKGEIKRNFNCEEFAVEVKRVAIPAANSGKRTMFVETTKRKVGLSQNGDDTEIGDWRLTCSDGFVEAFSASSDGLTWNNQGGCHLEADEKPVYLGFSVEGGAVFRFSACATYRSPFLRIQGFPEDHTAKLLSVAGDVLKTEPFGADMTARIELDHPMNAKVEVYNQAGNPAFTSQALDFLPGDIYLWTERNLELLYGGKVLDFGPNPLNASAEVQSFILRNADSVAATRLLIGVSGQDATDVTLSLDGTTYSAQLSPGDLAPSASLPFYAKVDNSGSGYAVKEFEITVK